MPSDAKAKRAAKKAEKQNAAKVKAGATVSEADAASVASTDTAASKPSGQADKPAFFERTGKNAAARKSMNMDISVTDIQLWAGQVGGSVDGHAGGQELIDRATLALTFGRNYGMVCLSLSLCLSLFSVCLSVCLSLPPSLSPSLPLSPDRPTRWGGTGSARPPSCEPSLAARFPSPTCSTWCTWSKSAQAMIALRLRPSCR
jgi:hypothetical protein